MGWRGVRAELDWFLEDLEDRDLTKGVSSSNVGAAYSCNLACDTWLKIKMKMKILKKKPMWEKEERTLSKSKLSLWFILWQCHWDVDLGSLIVSVLLVISSFPCLCICVLCVFFCLAVKAIKTCVCVCVCLCVRGSVYVEYNVDKLLGGGKRGKKYVHHVLYQLKIIKINYLFGLFFFFW